MFGKRDESKPQGRIDTLIGVGTLVEGNIRFTGGLRIDGEVKGNVEMRLMRASRRGSKDWSPWRIW